MSPTSAVISAGDPEGSIVASAEALQSERLRALWRYWRSLHRGDRLPGRSDIDPAAIPQLLPYVMLLDVLGDPPDFRYRLVGTHIVQIHRADNTGKRVSEAFAGAESEQVLRLYRRVVNERAAIGFRGQPLRRDGRMLDYEVVHMPLIDRQDRVNMVLAGLEFTILPGQSAAQP